MSAEIKVGDTVIYRTYGGSITGKVRKLLDFPWDGCALVKVHATDGVWKSQTSLGAEHKIKIEFLEVTENVGVVEVNAPVQANTVHYCATCGYTEVPTVGTACKWCMG